MKTNAPTVTPEEFVQAWQTSESLDEVAKRLGLYRSLCYSRAAHYRRKGVALKEFPRKASLDWAGLQRLAESLKQGE